MTLTCQYDIYNTYVGMSLTIQIFIPIAMSAHCSPTSMLNCQVIYHIKMLLSHYHLVVTSMIFVKNLTRIIIKIPNFIKYAIKIFERLKLHNHKSIGIKSGFKPGNYVLLSLYQYF